MLRHICTGCPSGVPTHNYLFTFGKWRTLLNPPSLQRHSCHKQIYLGNQRKSNRVKQFSLHEDNLVCKNLTKIFIFQELVKDSKLVFAV